MNATFGWSWSHIEVNQPKYDYLAFWVKVTIAVGPLIVQLELGSGLNKGTRSCFHQNDCVEPRRTPPWAGLPELFENFGESQSRAISSAIGLGSSVSGGRTMMRRVEQTRSPWIDIEIAIFSFL